MKAKYKLGIVGGMGSRAGTLLLQKVIDYSPAVNDQEFIDTILHSNSAIPDRTRAIVYNEPSPVPEILRSLKLFEKNQIDYVILACITSYFYYHEIIPHIGTKMQILHPLPLVREYIRIHFPKVKKIGLLATTGTIQTGLFQNEFYGHPIEVITLGAQEQENIFMQSVYMENGLKSSSISSEAIDLLHQSIPILLQKGVELIVGGCTEIPLALNPSMLPVPFVDTLDVLAKKAVKLCYISENLESSKKIGEYLN